MFSSNTICVFILSMKFSPFFTSFALSTFQKVHRYLSSASDNTLSQVFEFCLLAAFVSRSNHMEGLTKQGAKTVCSWWRL